MINGHQRLTRRWVLGDERSLCSFVEQDVGITVSVVMVNGGNSGL